MDLRLEDGTHILDGFWFDVILEFEEDDVGDAHGRGSNV